jgi:hypothetical protein
MLSINLEDERCCKKLVIFCSNHLTELTFSESGDQQFFLLVFYLDVIRALT